MSGFISTSSTTDSVSIRLALDELIACARASVAHQLSIAKARRFFSDTDASEAVADAEALAKQIENQISKLSALPAIAALLLDLSTEPARRVHFEPAPMWAELLAARAGTQLAALLA